MLSLYQVNLPIYSFIGGLPNIPLYLGKEHVQLRCLRSCSNLVVDGSKVFAVRAPEMELWTIGPLYYLVFATLESALTS